MPDASRVVLTVAQLRTVCPRLTEQRAATFLPFLQQAMRQYGIDRSLLRTAAFLAQTGHESLDFTRLVEMPHLKPVKSCKLCRTKCPHEAGEQYEGRLTLGNVRRGDGILFKGRGVLQLTGRYRYDQATRALGVDFVGHPDLAFAPQHTFRIAGWYWEMHGLNTLADAGDFDSITRLVNGGYNGKADRDARFANAIRALGVDLPRAVA